MAFGLPIHPRNTRIHTVLAAVLPVANYLISIDRICFDRMKLDRAELAWIVPSLEEAENKAKQQLDANPKDTAARWRHMMIRECNRAVRLCNSAASEGKHAIDVFALATDANPKAELSFFHHALHAMQGGAAGHTTIENPSQRCISLVVMREDSRLKRRITALRRRSHKPERPLEMGLAPYMANHLFKLKMQGLWTWVEPFPLLPLRKREVVLPYATCAAYQFGNTALWLDPQLNELDTLLGIPS